MQATWNIRPLCAFAHHCSDLKAAFLRDAHGLQGADLRTDLALLKVDGRNDFPYVRLADHEPRPSADTMPAVTVPPRP